MLSLTRGRSRSPTGRLQRLHLQKGGAMEKYAEHMLGFLPPEVVSTVFSLMPLADLIPMRSVSAEWKELVDLEARLRFLRLTGDDSCPFVLQAGPPALFDVCEFLGLSFAGYKEPGNVVDRTHPAIVGTLCVSHHNHNPYHQTSMSAHDSMLFQNIILSITRVEQKLPQNSSMSRQMAYRSWTNWEVARETDRIWRDWWDGAPLTPPSSLPGSREGTPPHDSGFSEGALFNRCEKAMSNPDSLSIDGARGKRLKDLDIGKLIHRATMDVSITDDDPREHQYRWTSVDLDVYRVLLAYEERVSRSGLRAMVSAQRMLVI